LRKYHSRQEFSAKRHLSDCRSRRAMSSTGAVKWAIAAALLATGTDATAAAAPNAPLFDSVRLNIGLNCRWERRCIAAQTSAMHRALAYVRTKHPPQARIHLCNRNASRGRPRIDWIGFDNCIRKGWRRSS
jgi:hypothetical protein